jgi:hypothetical protein
MATNACYARPFNKTSVVGPLDSPSTQDKKLGVFWLSLENRGQTNEP